MRLRVRRGAPAAGAARLADFLPDREAFALHTDGAALWLSVLCPTRGRLVEDRYALDAAAASMVDQTVFIWDELRFVEAERRTTEGGPNLHAAPISLPARMAPGAAVAAASGRVTLVHHGRAQLRWAAREWEVDAIALVGEHEGRAQVQWMARGVGPIALGPLGAPPARWCVGFTGGAAWPEPVPEPLLALPRAPLRAGPHGRPGHHLF